MFKDIAELVFYSYIDGEMEEIKHEVYVNRKSVKRQEFYTAYQSGLTASCVFELRVEDFEMTRTVESDTGKALYATRILYEGAIYEIIRTYEKEDGMIELTCS